MQGVQVQALVGELSSHMLRGTAKKLNKHLPFFFSKFKKGRNEVSGKEARMKWIR